MSETITWKRGDLVYYTYRCGWGGGETGHALAMIVTQLPKRVQIIVKTDRGAFVVKTVARHNVVPRTVINEAFDYDAWHEIGLSV